MILAAQQGHVDCARLLVDAEQAEEFVDRRPVQMHS